MLGDATLLLPKRKRGKSDEFLWTRSILSLINTQREHPFRITAIALSVSPRVYDRALPHTGGIRDYDNLSEKQLLDLLSSFVMADDTGLLCDAYNTAELG